MATMAQLAREVEYNANLQRARRRPLSAETAAPKETSRQLKPISLIEAFFVISFLAIFFDLPQALFAATFVGIVLNVVWVPIGYLVAYIWLKLKGRSLLGGKSGNKLFYLFGLTSVTELISGGFLPGLSGFVLGVIITEQLERSIEKVGSAVPGGDRAAKTMKKLGNISKH